MQKKLFFSLCLFVVMNTWLRAQNTFPATGNVGIGTTSPAMPLHIVGTSGIRLEGTGTGTDIIDMLPGVAVGFSRLDYRAGNAGRGISFQLMPNGANTMSKLVLANQSDQANFSSVFLLAESTGFSISPQHVGTAANPITSLSIGGGTSGLNWSKVIIPGTGNVGIGTTTPTAQLSLSKSAAYTNPIGAAANPAVLIKNSSAANFNEKAELQFAIGNTDYASAAISALYTKYFASNDVGADLVFSTKGVSGDATDLTEKMRIIANGNVGIGTSSPTVKLQIGDFATSNSNAFVIPGSYNFEQVRMGQYGNGNAGLELINHTDASNSYGIKFLTYKDQVPGLQIQYAPATTAYNSLSYTTGLFMGLNGNVGIGFTTPSEKLDVNGNGNFRGTLISARTGDVGGTISLQNPTKTSAGTAGSWNIYNMTGPYGNSLQFWAYDGIGCTTGGLCASRFTIMDNGNVGIGTTNPGTYKLAVEGTIGARKIQVTSAAWADYVFDNDYKLRPLSEVENYINQNKHLPDVPSAKEVTANGIDIGDNQAVLLKKIEELTLYSISQQKQLADHKRQIAKQQSELNEKNNQLVELNKKLESLLSRLEKLEQK